MVQAGSMTWAMASTDFCIRTIQIWQRSLSMSVLPAPSHCICIPVMFGDVGHGLAPLLAVMFGDIGHGLAPLLAARNDVQDR